MSQTTSILALVIRAGNRTCAIPVVHALETMRPLPIESLPNVPEFVRGISIIRGMPVPVVDLRVVLALPSTDPPRRFVTVRCAGRPVALAVDATLGVRDLRALPLSEVPSLLSEANRDMVAALGSLDSELLLVLKSATMVSPELWASLDRRASTP